MVRLKSPPAEADRPAVSVNRPESQELVTRPKVVPMPEFGVCVFESRHGPGFIAPKLVDEFSKFLLVISGHARWDGDGRMYLVGPNSLVHVPRGMIHRQEDVASDPVSLFAIHYRPRVLVESLAQALNQRGFVHWNLSGSDFPLARYFRADFREMLFEQDTRRDGWETIMLSCLGHLAVRALRLTQRPGDALHPTFSKASSGAQRVATYVCRLQSTFYTQKTLEDAAQATGLSRRQFTELFCKITHRSWKEYLQGLRLAHARDLLGQTDKSVVAVSFESGFEDLSHFHRVFKHAFGLSPLAYRKQHARH